jgi:hypothetical protein
MPTRFDNKVIVDIGTELQTVITTTSTERATIVGFNVTNPTALDCYFDVKLTDALSTTGYYLKNISLPSENTYKVITNGERLVLGPSTSLAVQSTLASSVHVVLSYVVIT